ncbi:MAG TPA: hypothetical protein VEK38_01305, partial [Candidatus Bathyarchaeia archaeon]|nr:hypothetical protein [Candidatus Bathyarchaeia archaeon]
MTYMRFFMGIISSMLSCSVSQAVNDKQKHVENNAIYLYDDVGNNCLLPINSADESGMEQIKKEGYVV